MWFYILIILLSLTSYQFAMDVPLAAATNIQVTAEQRKTLFGYIHKGWENFFERKLDSEKIPVETCDEQGESLLHVASAQGQPKITRILLARGANVHALSGYAHVPPLYSAVNSHPGALEVVEQLLAHGADPFCKDMHKATPLLIAAAGGYVPIVVLIFTKSQFSVKHALLKEEELETAIRRITAQRIAKGKALLEQKDITQINVLQRVTIDMGVLSLKTELQDYEVERLKNFKLLLPLLDTTRFEQNYEKDVQADVRKILIDSQKKHK